MSANVNECRWRGAVNSRWRTLVLLPLLAIATQAEPYRSADLPPVLRFLDGREVKSAADWLERREEIKRLWCETYLGRFPETPPKLLQAETLSEVHDDSKGYRVRNVKLTFGTPNQASFEIRLLIPSTKEKSYPLLLTQPRNYQIAWGEAAVKRGYITCFYPGVDYNHREAAFPGYESAWRRFQKEYPRATWSSSLAIQSWLAGRALDYLLSEQCDLNIAPEQVAIIGHSRYGKQSLYAAAFDERIKAVVSRSAGSPAAAGYRFTGRDTFMETVLDYPGEWALPGVKSYFGREHELPVESNGLLAAIAPRACLLHTAYNDGSDPTYAVERSYLEARNAYTLLGQSEKIALHYRAGNHNPITEEHIASNLDWFDWVFGRGEVKRSSFPNRLLHHFDWAKWKQRQPPVSLKPPADGSLAERVQWMLGEEPAGFDRLERRPLSILAEDDYGVAKWSRDRWKPKGVVRLPVSFGRNVHGNLAYPARHEGPLPVVIWLHPFNYSHGSNEGYGVQGTTIYYRLAQQGYAVLSFDQCGFGDRLLEGAEFYEKYPGWSKMGRMVFDVRCAIDFLKGGPGIAEGAMPEIDKRKVILLGYSLGGMVALHTAALDERVTAVASFCGFTPMKTDLDHGPTGGTRRWWEWHGLQPKLGLFLGKEASIPYDYDELLKSIAPRPTLVYSATKDRQVDPAAVRLCLGRVKRPTLATEIAEDVNRFQAAQHAVLAKWLETIKE